MPVLGCRSDSNQDSCNLVSNLHISSGQLDLNTLTQNSRKFNYDPSEDMRDFIGMGVIGSKPDPKRRVFNNGNGAEHNNKSPRDTHKPYRDDPVLEVCTVKSQLEASPKQFLRINKLKAWIERKTTTIDESSPGVLKYRTPHFRAQAQVEVPALGAGERIQIGWIQTCIQMQFVNCYGKEGLTSWEFPEIVSGKFNMISDADGKQYPWYGAKRELSQLDGPCNKQSLTLEMNDNFFPQVTWHIPDEAYDRKPRLTRIHRKQKFYTCLAVRDINTGKMYIYRTLAWTMELNIQVDPTQQLGYRATLLEPLEQRQPKLLKHNITLPLHALKPPNANKSQALVWRPRHGEARIVVQPQETTMDMSKYLSASRHLSDRYTAMMMPES